MQDMNIKKIFQLSVFHIVTAFAFFAEALYLLCGIPGGSKKHNFGRAGYRHLTASLNERQKNPLIDTGLNFHSPFQKRARARTHTHTHTHTRTNTHTCSHAAV